MNVILKPIDERNREAVLALSVRDDQPFVADNRRSLEQAAAYEQEAPGSVRPFAVFAEGRPVGFAMLVIDPHARDPFDRYSLWRLMIDRHEQNKGYGQAAMAQIIRYFRNRGADRVLLSTVPENKAGLHVFGKFGFAATGEMNEDEAVLSLDLTAEKEEDDAP